MRKLLPLCAILGSVLQAQTVTTTPTSLSFTYQYGSTTLPPAQTVSVKAGTSTPTYTTSFTPGTALWLTVAPDSGKLPATVSVRVNPTSLTVGVYSATAVITVTGVGSPINVAVSLTVNAAPSTLTVSPATLTFATPPNPPTNQALTLSTNGAPISFTATAGSPWMTISPAVGVVTPGTLLPLTVAVDSTALIPQTAPYVGKITIVASGASVTAKSQTITVNLTVNSSVPTVTGVWPTTLPVNSGAQNITIRGTNFYSASVVKVTGVPTALTTTVVSSTAVIAVVPATMLTAPQTLNVLVSNPAPGGDSATSPVTVANVPAILGIVNASSYAIGTVSPGQLATVFGTNIGPTIPASMTITAGFVDTTLSGVTATVDGQNAPLIYVSPSQVTLQIPYEVSLGAAKAVVITNGGNPAANGTVTIAATQPGLFTADGSGFGGAAALNYNATTLQYTLNTGANPAKIGDTVVLYLTGEGDYNLTPISGATNTGYVIPPTLMPLPQMSPLPTLTIGGVAATVAYAGPIVGSIIGVLQMNVVVPVGATTGAAVPVVVTMGGNSTQAAVTLGIHP